MIIFTCLKRICAIFFALFWVLPAMGQSSQGLPYPSRPVRIIVSFPPGGNLDLVGRMIADELSKTWERPVIVENRAGAGGTIGMAYAAKQAPDGYTLVIAGLAMNAIAPSIYSNITYDPNRDFAYITPLTFTPNVLVVSPKLGVSNVKELVAYLRAQGGKANYSSPGIGVSDHLMMELFLKEAGVSALHVPYKGSAEARTAIIAGDVHATFGTVSAAVPQVLGGVLKAVGISGRQRSPLLPGIPTIAEAGLPGLVAYTWTGLAAPAGTPPDIITKIHRDVTAVLGRSDVRERIAASSSEVIPMTPDQFRAFVASEGGRWGETARLAGVKVE